MTPARVHIPLRDAHFEVPGLDLADARHFEVAAHILSNFFGQSSVRRCSVCFPHPIRVQVSIFRVIGDSVAVSGKIIIAPRLHAVET